MNKGGCAVGKKEGKGGCKLGKKKKLIVMANKGGCAEGKKEGKGGCKVGKKKKLVVKPKGTLSLPKAKKKIEKTAAAPTKNKTAVKPVAKKKAMVGKKKLVIVSNGPFARQKKLKDTKAKTEEVKKEIARQKKAKARAEVAKSLAKVKKDELPELMAITGLGKSEANAKSPLELFGMLPKELGQMVLNPSQRGGGAKVGHQSPLSLVEKYNSLTEAEALRYKGARMKSLDTILKDAGRLYGRLPKTNKVNYASGQDPQFGRGTMKFRTGSTKLYEDVELFKLYTRKFGPEYATRIGRILEDRLSSKNFKPEKQYQKELEKAKKAKKKREILYEEIRLENIRKYGPDSKKHMDRYKRQKTDFENVFKYGKGSFRPDSSYKFMSYEEFAARGYDERM